MHHLVPLVLGDGAQLWQSEPPHRASYYNASVCLFEHSLQSTIIRCLLVRSIQPGYPGVLTSILAIFCTARNGNGFRLTPKNKMASLSPGLKYMRLSSRPQGRYIVTRRSSMSMARAPLSVLEHFKPLLTVTGDCVASNKNAVSVPQLKILQAFCHRAGSRTLVP